MSRVILYDGACGLCNLFVRFILARDPAGVFSFASLESGGARRILLRHGYAQESRPPVDSVVLVEGFEEPGERLRWMSDAVIGIARHLEWPWSLLRFLVLLPLPLRNGAYRLVARFRRRLGQPLACPRPAPEALARFIR